MLSRREIMIFKFYQSNRTLWSFLFFFIDSLPSFFHFNNNFLFTTTKLVHKPLCSLQLCPSEQLRTTLKARSRSSRQLTYAACDRRTEGQLAALHSHADTSAHSTMLSPPAASQLHTSWPRRSCGCPASSSLTSLLTLSPSSSPWNLSPAQKPCKHITQQWLNS